MRFQFGLAVCTFPFSFGIISHPLLREDSEENVDCSADGEFFHPGKCGQVPLTNCTKHLLPSFLFIGESHSGSTTYAWQLNLHPNLSYGVTKEHIYFTRASPRSKDMIRDWAGYEEQFHVDCTVQRTFDATPHTMYLSYAGNGSNPPCGFPWRSPGPGALKDLRKTLGQDLKIILMIRDPLDWVMSFHDLTDIPSFERSLANHPSYCPADYVDGWLQGFPRSQLLFLASEDYFADPRSILAQTFDFLDVPKKKYADEELKSYGRRRTKNHHIITDEYREKWHAQPQNKECKRRLEASTGLRFNWKGSV